MKGFRDTLFKVHTLLPYAAAALAIAALYGFSAGLVLALLATQPLYATLGFFLTTALFSNIFAKFVAALARRP